MRVEIISPNHLSCDVNLMIDVCCNCISAFYEGDFLPEEIFEQYHPESIIGPTNVGHPNYLMDEEANCELCGKRLSSEDN